MKKLSNQLLPWTDEQLMETLIELGDMEIQDLARTGPVLTLDRIAEICCHFWQIPFNDLIGKIDHTKAIAKERKLTFLRAAYYYTNFYCNDIAKYMGCTWKSVVSSLTVHYYEYSRKERSKQLVELFLSLEKELPGRLDQLNNVSLKSLSYCKNWYASIAARLTLYQVSKIPLRNREWLNKQDDKTFLAFPTDKIECYYIRTHSYSELDVLFHLQRKGYRISTCDDFGQYREMHPICEKCIHNVSCNIKGILNDTIFKYTSLKREYCFEGLPDNPLRVDLDLLEPLPIYMLQ